MSKTIKRICMWSGPRNISTALMYSFRQRSDTTVFDEPHYGHYLKTVGVEHPGDQDVMANMNCNGNEVTESIILGEHGTPVAFFKNMAHHLEGLETSFLARVDNLLLTRHPHDMLTSLIKNLPNPVLRDTGLKEQHDLLQMILAAGQEPIVLESREVLKNPRSVLTQLCNKLAIPFEESMLSWPAGPKPEDGIWAKYWYHNVHKSTGFAPYQAKNDVLPGRLEPLLNDCLGLYDTLKTYSIKGAA